MAKDFRRPQTTSRLIAQMPDDAPSAAAAGQADGDKTVDSAEAGEGQTLVPVTAWTSPEDCAALARGLQGGGSPAEWAFARLTRMIEDFEAKLDQEHEIGMSFVDAPGMGFMRVEDMGFWAPDILLFYGKNSYGKPERLLQHYTRLNVRLSAEPKQVEQEPPRRIGFALRQRLETPEPPAPEEITPGKNS